MPTPCLQVEAILRHRKPLPRYHRPHEAIDTLLLPADIPKQNVSATGVRRHGLGRSVGADLHIPAGLPVYPNKLQLGRMEG